jgi:hypothetical protein
MSNKLIFKEIIGESLVESFVKEKIMQKLKENIVFDVVKVLKTGDIPKAKRFLVNQGYKPVACRAILEKALELFRSIA